MASKSSRLSPLRGKKLAGSPAMVSHLDPAFPEPGFPGVLCAFTAAAHNISAHHITGGRQAPRVLRASLRAASQTWRVRDLLQHAHIFSFAFLVLPAPFMETESSLVHRIAENHRRTGPARSPQSNPLNFPFTRIKSF